ncbi:MAG: hypothetical protein KME29_27140 [Calothrix sp. FI2-JRJ7]|nr:hypothetical protein [Calothrix sp. FI2-JRJ7]
MKQLIDNIKHNITPQSFRWAYPIALELQKHHNSLPIQWAVECIQIYASEFQPNKLSQLGKYIQQAIEEQDTLSAVQCGEIGTEIWYWGTQRDDFQTALARLWWSISAFKDGEELSGITEAESTVELLFDTLNRGLVEQFLEAALRICEEYELQK